MTKILVGAMAGVLGVILFVFMLTRLSSDALGLAVGVVFGVLAGIPSALLVLASSRRQAGDHGDDDEVDDFDYDQMRRRDMRRLQQQQQQQQGERDLPPYPYQPPVIVLAAPMADGTLHTVNNTYNDNRSVTIHAGGAAAVPTIYDRQREIAVQQGRKEVQRLGHNGQGARVFRVVGSDY